MLSDEIVAVVVDVCDCRHIEQLSGTLLVRNLHTSSGGVLMMSEFESIVMCFLIPMFASLCYVAGKGDFLNVIVLMIQEKVVELEERLKEGGADDV